MSPRPRCSDEVVLRAAWCLWMKGPCGSLKGRPNVTVELIEGAHHGWDTKRFSTPHNDPAGNVMLYSEEATKKSHEIVRDFLAKHLKK